MTDYRDPKTGERTAVLRPSDPQKCLARLAEWNRLMDTVDLAEGAPRLVLMESANALWLTMLREQGWRSLGWLADDAKGTSSGEAAAPGDLHMPEKCFEKDFRP